ncbi:PREDICTED: uncharacterized protein LOC106749944 [Dinoponera quadriceps]|uniref:Uncharacterized protein LOC106749944 n=1 Tax=Dinoponera quadriceps TaxID=609295 RepID=A0A6P3Y3H7_DINQU|nr:PREDICTED: uncharacterized protein LOC106749944 [Dinoponera quadriceps]
MTRRTKISSSGSLRVSHVITLIISDNIKSSRKWSEMSQHSCHKCNYRDKQTNDPTCSVIIPIIHCMTAAIINCIVATEIGNEFKFQHLETTRILAKSTILDSRFKRLHFKSASAVSQAIQVIDNQLRNMFGYGQQNRDKEDTQDVNDINNAKSSSQNLWHLHDSLVMKNKKIADTVSDSWNLELKQYLN